MYEHFTYIWSAFEFRKFIGFLGFFSHLEVSYGRFISKTKNVIQELLLQSAIATRVLLREIMSRCFPTRYNISDLIIGYRLNSYVMNMFMK